MPSFSNRTAVQPYIIGPVVKSANWSAFALTFDVLDFDTQVKSAYVNVDTTLAAEATNYLTITLVEVAASGGAETTIATITTNSSGGAAITADTPSLMTLTTTLGNAQCSAGNYLRLKFTPATGTVAALDVLTVSIRTTPGASGGLS